MTGAIKVTVKCLIFFNSANYSNLDVSKYYMSQVMRKPVFCIHAKTSCRSVYGNSATDQRLCFFVIHK